MIDHPFVPLGAISLAISLFVETSSWWVRAQATTGTMGLYVSRSNIYLYGGRFFTLAFTALVAFWIETGARPYEVALFLGGSLAFASIFQIALLQIQSVRELVLSLIVYALRLPKPKWATDISRPRSPVLFTGTAAASLIFGLGIGVPLLAAVLVPEFRLSVSYLGQIINSIGTLVILFLIDQLLFRSLDNGTLERDVYIYSNGRAIGILLAGMVFFLVGIFLYK